jgi:hypothetical protein
LISALVIVVVCALCTALVFVARILRKLYKNPSVEELTPEWAESFSVSYYAPMVGLLSDEDFQFLARQPGFDFALRRKLRKERLQIFRGYLRKLVCDFNRLHLAIRLSIARQPRDHSALVTQLIWLKVRFSISLLRVEVSYLLCWMGVRTIHVGSLVSYLEEMSAKFQAISVLQESSMPAVS